MRGFVFAAGVAVSSAMLLIGQAEAGSKIKKEGKASWYKMGTRTANGERYDPMGITAAHPSLPFDTRVRVTNASSGDSVVVRINDRGPFTGGRIIDLSQGAAEEINMVRAGIARVKIEVLDSAAPAQAAAEPETEPRQAVAQPVRDEPFRLLAEQRMGGSPR